MAEPHRTHSAAGVDAVAQALLAARAQRQPADATPLAQALRDADAAYAVQQQVLRALQGSGAAAPLPRHWKSGGPSSSAVLTHAPLPDAGVWASPAHARGFHFNQRVIEAEVALRLARDVTPAEAAALTPEHANTLADTLVDAMTVSIEIVDFRWQQCGQAPALLKLADLQSHGALVLGAWVPYQRRDWARQTCAVTIGTQAPQTFQGTHSLGDPAWLLPAWLRHATRAGQTVPAGTVVTTGTWCGMLPASAGDRVVARFDGVGEAVVTLDV